MRVCVRINCVADSPEPIRPLSSRTNNRLDILARVASLVYSSHIYVWHIQKEAITYSPASSPTVAATTFRRRAILE
jgi:hypothetical protein